MHHVLARMVVTQVSSDYKDIASGSHRGVQL